MKMISRYGIYLRLIDESDAEFILSLRTNPRLNTHISYTSPNMADQIKWLQDYKIKEKKGQEYYFVSLDQEGNKYGTIRLYDIDDRSFEAGSWIFMPNAPFGMAVKTHIIAIETGFEYLNAEFCKITVRKKNLGVIRYIENLKGMVIKEDDLDLYFVLSKENFYHRKNKLAVFSQLNN